MYQHAGPRNGVASDLHPPLPHYHTYTPWHLSTAHTLLHPSPVLFPLLPNVDPLAAHVLSAQNSPALTDLLEPVHDPTLTPMYMISVRRRRKLKMNKHKWKKRKKRDRRLNAA